VRTLGTDTRRHAQVEQDGFAAQREPIAGYLRPCNPKLIANRASGRFLDFAMPRHRSTPAVRRISIDAVATAFAIEHASMPLKMAN
jgi:hypothetical protein